MQHILSNHTFYCSAKFIALARAIESTCEVIYACASTCTCGRTRLIERPDLQGQNGWFYP